MKLMMSVMVMLVGAVTVLADQVAPVGDAGTLAPLKANFVRVLRQLEPNVYKVAYGDVQTDRVQKLLRSQREDGTWPDVDYRKMTRSRWPAGNLHLSHLVDIARAPRTPATESACHKALGYWLKGDFRNPNWWWNEIGVPQRIGSAGLLMDEFLTPTERAGIVKILRRSRIGMTGQNRIWLAECVLMRSLLENDPATARAAREAIVGEIAMSKTVEGIQSDWSFHQHGNLPQFGNYGSSYITTLPRLVAIFAGTEWAVSDEQYEILERLIDRGFRPTVWRGAMDVGSIGRQLGANAARTKGNAPLTGARWLALSGRPESQRIYRDCLADRSGKPAESPHLGLTWFSKSAMGMYRTTNWMIAVKCQTKSIRGTELVNEDNLLGAHLADGALFSYVTGDEYRDVFPFWNWRHIPGITSYDVGSVNWKSSNLSEVAEKTSGNSVRFVLERDGLHAETNWKFSDAGVTVSVTGISSSSGRPVVTAVEQSVAQSNARWERKGDILVAVNGAIRYELPTNAVVSVTTRHGSWKRHMGADSGEDLVGRVFEVTIPHGINPSGAACSWKVLPCGPTP